jgi:hypothetical protein
MQSPLLVQAPQAPLYATSTAAHFASQLFE